MSRRGHFQASEKKPEIYFQGHKFQWPTADGTTAHSPGMPLPECGVNLVGQGQAVSHLPAPLSSLKNSLSVAESGRRSLGLCDFRELSLLGCAAHDPAIAQGERQRREGPSEHQD